MIMDMERGPRYNAYAKLRETKLQNNYLRLQQYQQQQEQEQENVLQPTKIPTPPTKQIKFHAGVVSGRKGSSLIAQSVPDFSSMLRKENRKPPTNMLPTISSTATLTPPLKNKNKVCGVLSNSRGSSRSANSAAEKKKGVGGGGGGEILMARKSYANFDELRSFSSATANAINGESTRNSRVVGKKTVLRCREF
ncbi:unnamed protein product [Trifolium pratense]|uniref:Uncharacterized protein n=1 Tax=Trifolium pratense TaxID=57577 RepID=A0ACB0K589_TRIPR|nr:unnamed protein product [Trifolium pratense]